MKRMIFALLHSEGSYMLSRNFRLQRVGDIDWVLRNYEIRRVSLGIDELMVIDVSRRERDRGSEQRFHRDVERLVQECFIPVTVGGHLRSLDQITRCFAVGADKVLLRTAFVEDPSLCEQVATRYGSQAVIAGVDISRQRQAGAHEAGPKVTIDELPARLRQVIGCGAGEVLIQSVDNDGTGMGLDLEVVTAIGTPEVPVILMGGVGHARHIVEGLTLPSVDAIATANLFNFVGDALVDARSLAQGSGVRLARWSQADIERTRDVLR
jgi:cyclase